MAKQTINLGTNETSGDGESIRSAFDKCNDNFDELYAGAGIAFDGDYNSLTNQPVLFDGSYLSLTNTPTIPVDLSDLTDTDGLLTSGSYNDLTDKPTIPADVSDLTDTTNLLNHFSGDYADLANKPTLFDGDYNSLTNQPAIPSLGTFALGSNTITTNLGGDIDIAVSGPTAGDPPAFIQKTWRLATDGSLQFVDPMDFLSPVKGTVSPTTITEWNTAYSWGDHSTAGYSTFSGSYNDLLNKPTIPSALTDLSISDGTTGQVLTTDGAGNFTFTTVSSGSNYGDSDVATYLNGNLDSAIIPDTNNTYDLGSAEYKFRDLYLSDATIYLGDTPISVNTGELNFNGTPLSTKTYADNAAAGAVNGLHGILPWLDINQAAPENVIQIDEQGRILNTVLQNGPLEAQPEVPGSYIGHPTYLSDSPVNLRVYGTAEVPTNPGSYSGDGLFHVGNSMQTQFKPDGANNFITKFDRTRGFSVGSEVYLTGQNWIGTLHSSTHNGTSTNIRIIGNGNNGAATANAAYAQLYAHDGALTVTNTGNTGVIAAMLGQVSLDTTSATATGMTVDHAVAFNAQIAGYIDSEGSNITPDVTNAVGLYLPKDGNYTWTRNVNVQNKYSILSQDHETKLYHEGPVEIGTNGILMVGSTTVNSGGATLSDTLTLPALTAEPTDPQDGMIARADGVSWDPAATGSTALVVYLGGAWKVLASAGV